MNNSISGYPLLNGYEVIMVPPFEVRVYRPIRDRFFKKLEGCWCPFLLYKTSFVEPMPKGQSIVDDKARKIYLSADSYKKLCLALNKTNIL